MATLVYSAPAPVKNEVDGLDVYLQAAARIVETVAFEMATQMPATSIEELLAIASNIEHVADSFNRSIQ